MTKEDAKNFLYSIAEDLGFTGIEDYTCKDGEKMCDAIKILEQEQKKIKVLNRDEAIKKLGTVDIYQASAWITLLNDLEHLGLKICEVEK